jgi:hypothetical protein
MDNTTPANTLAENIRSAASPCFMTGTAGQSLADVLSAALTDASGQPLNGSSGLPMSLSTADYVFFVFDGSKFLAVGSSASATLTGRRYLLAIEKTELLALLNSTVSPAPARGQQPSGTAGTAAARRAQHADGVWTFPVMIGGATGIESITLDDVQRASTGESWYDLQGRRLADRPTTKGIYLKGGRAVVVK